MRQHVLRYETLSNGLKRLQGKLKAVHDFGKSEPLMRASHCWGVSLPVLHATSVHLSPSVACPRPDVQEQPLYDLPRHSRLWRRISPHASNNNQRQHTGLKIGEQELAKSSFCQRNESATQSTEKSVGDRAGNLETFAP